MNHANVDIDAIYDALRDAAARHLPCPTYEALASRAGTTSASTAAHYLRRLEASGRISVHRRGRNGRQVTITATGESTAPIETGRQSVAEPAGFAALSRAAGDDAGPFKAGCCRFIPGESWREGVCGEPVQDGSSYCPEHHKRCHLKPGVVVKELEP